MTLILFTIIYNIPQIQNKLNLDRIIKIFTLKRTHQKMQSKIDQTITKLQKLKKHLSGPQSKNIYLLCGNENGGKNTLAHYIIEADIAFEVDDEGQDVLNIKNESERTNIVEGLLEIMPCPDRESIFVKLTGFLGSSKSQEEKQQYSLTLDYLLSLLSHLENSTIKFILILSQQQLQQDDDIFVKYHNCFRSVPDFVKRSHIVLSKIVDEDEFHEFVQRTSQDIIQQKQNCEYINEIIKEERIYGFYSRDIDEQYRYEFNEKINSTEVPPKLQISIQGGLIRQVMHESGSDLHHLAEKYNNQLKACLSVVNAQYIELLFKGAKIEPDLTLLKLQKEAFHKVYGKDIRSSYNNSISDQKKYEDFVKNYEKLFSLSKTAPQQLLPTFVKKLNLLSENYSENMNQSNVVSRIEILLLVCNAVAQKDLFEFLKSQQFYSIFINHENGAFEDHYLAKGFAKIKPMLSADFVKAHEKLASSNPKKKIIKKKDKNSIPNYQQQKKMYLSKPKKLSQILQLLSSPLKIDLLLEELTKQRKLKVQNVLQQKTIIKQIIKLLDLYQCYEEAIKFSWVMPDHFSIQKFMGKYIQNLKGLETDVPEKDDKIINQICDFYVNINRLQYVRSVENKLKDLQKHLQGLKKPKPCPIITKQLQKIQILLQNSKPAQTNQKQLVKHFMNYSKIAEIESQQKQLIQKCINFEQKNSSIIETNIVERWIMKGGELKVL